MSLPTPTTPPFATLIPGRRPEFKTHRGIGPARQAVGQPRWGQEARGGKVYRWASDHYEILHDIAPGTPLKELPWRIVKDTLAEAKARKRLDDIERDRALTARRIYWETIGEADHLEEGPSEASLEGWRAVVRGIKNS